MRKWWFAGATVASYFAVVGASFWNVAARGQEKERHGIHVVCPFLELGATNGGACLYYAYEHHPTCYDAELVAFETACGEFGLCEGEDNHNGCTELGGSVPAQPKQDKPRESAHKLPVRKITVPVETDHRLSDVGSALQPLGDPFIVKVPTKGGGQPKFAKIFVYLCKHVTGTTTRTSIVSIGLECKEDATASTMQGYIEKAQTFVLPDRRQDLPGFVQMKLGTLTLLVKVANPQEWPLKTQDSRRKTE